MTRQEAKAWYEGLPYARRYQLGEDFGRWGEPGREDKFVKWLCKLSAKQRKYYDGRT